MSLERVDDFEALPGWAWSLKEFDYDQSFNALQQFVEREGHARVHQKYIETFDGKELRIGLWVANRRRNYKDGSSFLSPERIAELESLSGWTWDPLETQYRQNITALKQFIEREGHARAPEGHFEKINNEEINIGVWCAVRRRDYSSGILSSEKIAELEALPGWQWSFRKKT